MPPARPWRERLWEKVEKTEDCWVWTGTKLKGYGHMGVDGKTVLCHRLTYEDAYGPIADGLVIDHLCRNPSCVRPDHLEPVPQRENARRGDVAKLTMEKARDIRARSQAGESNRDLAAAYGVDENTIGSILDDWSWREDYAAPRQPTPRPEVYCLECSTLITSGRRHKKFCCAKHRNQYNARLSYRRKTHAGT